jgi:hypothetical protein
MTKPKKRGSAGRAAGARSLQAHAGVTRMSVVASVLAMSILHITDSGSAIR